jgi:ribosomal protein L40E
MQTNRHGITICIHFMFEKRLHAKSRRIKYGWLRYNAKITLDILVHETTLISVCLRCFAENTYHGFRCVTRRHTLYRNASEELPLL